jgi:hypothetical protein
MATSQSPVPPCGGRLSVERTVWYCTASAFWLYVVRLERDYRLLLLDQTEMRQTNLYPPVIIQY